MKANNVYYLNICNYEFLQRNVKKLNNNASGQTVQYISLTGFDDSLLFELKVCKYLRSTAHLISIANLNHILHEIHLMEFT